jgi:hypothetical protein
MRKDDVFQSKYLKAADLDGNPITLTIASATLETLKNPKGEEQKKIVLGFRKAKKTLPPNLTNFEAVVDATGEDDTENWPGHKVELYPSEVQMGGKMVDCIRIRAAAQGVLKPKTKAAAAPVSDDMDDEIPF